jgi:hypothetical protein
MTQNTDPHSDLFARRTKPSLHTLGWISTIGIVLAVLGNAMSPYVGLKWEHSMAMFSNMRTDATNHYFLPRLMWFDNDKYVIVDRITIDRQELSPQSRMFLRLLDVTGQPAMSFRRAPGDPTACSDQVAINLNVVKYHLHELRERRVPALIILRDVRDGTQTEVDVLRCDDRWVSFTYFNQYPILQGEASYSTIHNLLRDHHHSQRELLP